jgi:MinD superfamily P-loop ATPase
MDKIAYIREAECIGCAKCISACGDKAILGARKLMHTIITDLCTGCEECIAPCPVDCIEMVDAPVIARRVATKQSTFNAPLDIETWIASPTARNDGSTVIREDDSKKDLIKAAIQRTLERRGWNNPS